MSKKAKGQTTVETKLGAAIRRLRKAKAMSQEKLAFESNIHVTYISSVETGYRNISLRNIIKISHALGVTASELMDEADL